MAHNLASKNGETSFFSVREKCWHGLGKIVQDAPTSEQAIKLAGLDYHVAKQPVYLGDGTLIEDSFATVRTDKNIPFGIVGGRYEVLQNVEAFDFFDEIVGKDAAIYETAGALGQGETIFITAKLPEPILVGRNDLIDQYLFLTNNHNGRGVVQAAFTPIRIVCNNTLNAALRQNSHRVRIMHNANVKDKVKQAWKIMGIFKELKTEVEVVFNAMAKKVCMDDQMKQILFETFGSPEQLKIMANGSMEKKDLASVNRLKQLVGEAFAYAMSSDTQQMDTTRGTVFGAYNAVTGYLQNVKEIKNAESNLNSLMDGTGYDYNQKAFNLCKALI